MTRQMVLIACLLGALLAGCFNLTREPPLPGRGMGGNGRMRSVENGFACMGSSNGYRTTSSAWCATGTCESRVCVARCSGPRNQDPVNGCEVSY